MQPNTIVKYTDNLYVLDLDPTYIKYIISVKEDIISLILKIPYDIFFDEIKFNKYEKSINYVINNKIATYYETSIIYYYGEYDISIYFKNISSAILIKVL